MSLLQWTGKIMTIEFLGDTVENMGLCLNVSARESIFLFSLSQVTNGCLESVLTACLSILFGRVNKKNIGTRVAETKKCGSCFAFVRGAVRVDCQFVLGQCCGWLSAPALREL